MIPNQNTSHVVVTFPWERVTDLIEACRDAGILPRQFPPGGGWDSLDLSVSRIDITFRVRYRGEVGPIRIEAWHPTDTDEIRLGASLDYLLLAVDVIETSTGGLLASIDYALSGRIYVSGSLEARTSQKGLFFVLRRVLVTLDDSSAGLPSPLPGLDLSQFMTRIVDRTIRAQLQIQPALPERQLPISTVIETGGLTTTPLYLNYQLLDPIIKPDWLSRHVCLPAQLGSPQCTPGIPQQTTFYDRVDLYGAPNGIGPPVHPNLLGRQFQVDVGVDLLRQAINAQRTSDWQGEMRWGIFKFSYNMDANIREWPNTGDNSAGFWFHLDAHEFTWYPKVKMCPGWTDTPFGRYDYEYPCGIEDGWAETQSVVIETMFRFFVQNNLVCVERLPLRFDHDQNLWGRLLEAIEFTLIALIPVIGPIVSAAVATFEVIAFIALVLAQVVARLVDVVVPIGACMPISQKFAELPIINDRVDVALLDALLEFKINGISIAFNGDFEKRT